MGFQLYRLENAPRSLPVWELLLDDLGRPPASRIAKTLGVGTSTVHRWSATGRAPRVACLALYWLTRWGRSDVDARAHNDAVAAIGLASALTEERDALRQNLEALRHEARRRSVGPADAAPMTLAATFAALIERREQEQLAAFWQVLGNAKSSHPLCPTAPPGAETVDPETPGEACNETAEKSQNETNWKVSLGPSLPAPHTGGPSGPADPATDCPPDRREPGPACGAPARPTPAPLPASTTAAPAAAPAEPAGPAGVVFGSLVSGVMQFGAWTREIDQVQAEGRRAIRPSAAGARPGTRAEPTHQLEKAIRPSAAGEPSAHLSESTHQVKRAARPTAAGAPVRPSMGSKQPLSKARATVGSVGLGVHAGEHEDSEPSLPLAGHSDARPGTPASASGLRPYMEASPPYPQHPHQEDAP